MECSKQIERDIKQYGHNKVAKEIIYREYKPISDIPSIETISNFLCLINKYFSHSLPAKFELSKFIVEVVKDMHESITNSNSERRIKKYILLEFAEHNLKMFPFWCEKIEDGEIKSEAKEKIKRFRKNLLYTKASLVIFEPQFLPLIDSLLYNLEGFELEVELMDCMAPVMKKLYRNEMPKRSKPMTLFDLWLKDKDDNYRRSTYKLFRKALFEEEMIDSDKESEMRWKLRLENNGLYKGLAGLIYILEKNSIISMKGVSAKLLLEILENTFHDTFGVFENFQPGAREKAAKESDEFKHIKNVIRNF